MTTVAALRTGYVNRHLGRADGSTIPWSDADVDAHITNALIKLWPEFGKYAAGNVATSQNSDIYTIPSALSGGRISRIELEYSSGGQSTLADRISSWRYYSDTQVRIRPLLATDAALSLRFSGWVPFATTGSDLPVRLEPAIAARAAGFAMGQLSGQLVNYQRQQGLDDGRVVDYPTAVGLAAYWERQYFEQLQNDASQVSYAPRRASR